MQYYQFHIGDYITDTAHLEPLEDLAYRRLLDLYYQTEKPIPNDNPVVSRRLRLGSEIVEIVLNEFFELTDNGWENDRCNEDISTYHAYKDKQKANGRKGGRPKKQPQNKPKNNPVVNGGKPKANPDVTQNNPNHEPLTINHKPLSYKKWNDDQFKAEVWKFKDDHTVETLGDFYRYWSETNTAGKMLFQLKPTWETGKRLGTWKKNNFGSAKPKVQDHNEGSFINHVETRKDY